MLRFCFILWKGYPLTDHLSVAHAKMVLCNVPAFVGFKLISLWVSLPLFRTGVPKKGRCVWTKRLLTCYPHNPSPTSITSVCTPRSLPPSDQEVAIATCLQVRSRIRSSYGQGYGQNHLLSSSVYRCYDPSCKWISLYQLQGYPKQAIFSCKSILCLGLSFKQVKTWLQETHFVYIFFENVPSLASIW